MLIRKEKTLEQASLPTQAFFKDWKPVIGIEPTTDGLQICSLLVQIFKLAPGLPL
jgi:hypothetical protein